MLAKSSRFLEITEWRILTLQEKRPVRRVPKHLVSQLHTPGQATGAALLGDMNGIQESTLAEDRGYAVMNRASNGATWRLTLIRQMAVLGGLLPARLKTRNLTAWAYGNGNFRPSLRFLQIIGRS
ncbi:MAG TPA: hypothetical protein VEI49_10125 [Terriglobales bacterium]|nr:hypothetical protein [Terriglobales bacterium]